MSDTQREEWIKVISVGGDQVLFYTEPDTEFDDEREKLHQIVRIDGVCADICLGGIPFDKISKKFATIDEAQAALVIKTVRDLLSGAKSSRGKDAAL